MVAAYAYYPYYVPADLNVLWSGKEALEDIASDDPPDEALSCRRRAWDVPYYVIFLYRFFHHMVRTEKLQNESFPNFSNFRPGFAPNFPRIFRWFSSWETETRNNSPKIPAIFQCKIFRQTRRKNVHKILLGSRQSNIWLTLTSRADIHKGSFSLSRVLWETTGN